MTELHVHEGQVFAGYGDYGANTGPIALTGLDPVTKTFGPTHMADSEAIYNIRSHGAQLVAPATDRRSAADFTTSNPWRDERPVASTHAFDMVSLDGSDVWLIGSKGNDAVAWRSLDDGSTWTEMQRVAPTVDGTFMRFYFGAVIDGRLFLQAVPSSGHKQDSSLVFDGSAWTQGPDLLPAGGYGWRPVPFAGGVVMHSYGHRYDAPIYFFDGTSARAITNGIDLEVVGNEVYVVAGNGVVASSADLTTWRAVSVAPAGTVSLAVDGSVLFAGDSEARIWSLDLAESRLPEAPDADETLDTPPAANPGPRDPMAPGEPPARGQDKKATKSRPEHGIERDGESQWKNRRSSPSVAVQNERGRPSWITGS